MNAFTVDVEEWFHICGIGGPLAPEQWEALPSRVEQTTSLLLDELDHAGVKATFFVLGWIAARHPALVGRIQAAGHSVGSHGYWHWRAYELGPSRFAADVADSVKALGAAGVSRVTAYRAPEWSVNSRTAWAFDVLARQGFTMDCSMAPVRVVGDPRYPRVPHWRRLEGGEMVEVPPFVTQRFGQAMPLGWGWALRRASPGDVARAIAHANQRGQPAVLTVHPWEIDPEPPRVRLPLRLHLAHYWGLSGFLDRLRTLLRTVPFSTLESVARSARRL